MEIRRELITNFIFCGFVPVLHYERWCLSSKWTNCAQNRIRVACPMTLRRSSVIDRLMLSCEVVFPDNFRDYHNSKSDNMIWLIWWLYLSLLNSSISSDKPIAVRQLSDDCYFYLINATHPFILAKSDCVDHRICPLNLILFRKINEIDEIKYSFSFYCDGTSRPHIISPSSNILICTVINLSSPCHHCTR